MDWIARARLWRSRAKSPVNSRGDTSTVEIFGLDTVYRESLPSTGWVARARFFGRVV